MKVAVILPAFNEEARVADVLRVVLRAPSVDDVIVVDDGSTDDTAGVVKRFPEVRLVQLPANRGKGGAMAAGARATDAEILVFLDADLMGLRVEHVEDLVSPLRCSRARMAVGRFTGGRPLTDWAQRLMPSISGQRAILRDVFEQIPNVARSRYGVETVITRFCHYYRVPTESVSISGVTHPIKEEKLGVWRGAASRARMYGQICRIMLDPRAPRRVRPRRNLLRRLATNARRQFPDSEVPAWVLRQERGLRRWGRARRVRKRL